MANALTRAIAPTLTVVDGQPTTTSTDVARHFGKLHKNVMRDIENLLPQLPADHALNFEPMLTDVAIGSGATRQDPAYRITKKGFTLLAFGFTGKKALQFKLDYIDEFERLEAELSGKAGQLPGPHPQRALPNALRQISAPELPAIDVRALLTTGQSEPVAMTPAQLALIEDKTWQLLGEARGLIHTHILRAVAFRSTNTDHADPQCRHIASTINEITLNKALAQSYWTELRHLQVCAQMALGVAQQNIKRLDDALAGKGLDAAVPLKTKKETP